MRKIAGFLIFACTAFGADPKLMNLVMPDAKILAGINVATAKTSPLGQFAIAQLQASMPQLQTAFAGLGFNPLTDVTELLMASTGDVKKPTGLLLMDGNFQVSQIVAALPQASVQTYAGATLITLPATKGKPVALAFTANGIAVTGDLASVEAALDRATGANSIDPVLAARVSLLSGDDAWMVSSEFLSAFMPGLAQAGGGAPQAGGNGAPAMQMLANIQSFSAGVQLGETVQVAVQAVANSDKNAEALGDVVRLLVSLGAMQTGSAQQGGPQLAGLIQLLQKMQISTSGPDLDLTLSIPEAQLETLFKSMASHGKALNGN